MIEVILYIVHQVLCLPNTQLDVQYTVQFYTHLSMAMWHQFHWLYQSQHYKCTYWECPCWGAVGGTGSTHSQGRANIFIHLTDCRNKSAISWQLLVWVFYAATTKQHTPSMKASKILLWCAALQFQRTSSRELRNLISILENDMIILEHSRILHYKFGTQDSHGKIACIHQAITSVYQLHWYLVCHWSSWKSHYWTTSMKGTMDKVNITIRNTAHVIYIL